MTDSRRFGSRPASAPEKGATSRGRFALEVLEDRTLLAVNPIVTENQLPGNPQSEWDVVGAGDPSIQGYSTDISVDQGQTVQFKVAAPATAPYHIDIYRMGYYAGLGARKVATIPSSQTLRQTQPAPLTNSATGLVDAGNWAVSASWAVPSTATSGIYVAKLVREDTGGASHMIFVVRDDDGASDLLFQTSDTTWQAYNNWGGKSLYDPSSDGGVRAYAVSYNRPLTVRGIEGGLGNSNGPFWAEIPMVRWLEANGYNVSYFTNVDADRHGAEILEHKAFLSVGHDEYWSAGQRTHVETARAAGVNLAFFSGNEVYWKVRWENSIDASGTPYRTMVNYKESTIRTGVLPQLPPEVQVGYVSGVEDPSPIWTGLWRDLRFPGNDAKVEQLLTGQIFSVNRGPGNMYGTSIQVPAEYGQMRLWRNTSIASLSVGQVATLSSGTLGYEWDEDVDSGYRPAGTINMSSTTEEVPEKLVDPISWPGCGGLPGGLCSSCRGCAVAPGTATHNLTLYRDPSGALVFGAGTVQWSWGLDGVHDGGASTPDIRMRQATVNLFADMGVKAGSLQAGLVQTTQSTDLTRPSSAVTSPASGQTFQAGVPVTITGTAADLGGGVVGGVEVSMDGGQSWRKATGRANWSYVWTPDTTGTRTILSRAADDSGNIEVPSAGHQVSVYLNSPGTTGLVAAYNFNAGSGATVADLSGNNNPGTISNATWSSGGVFGSNALSFNGTDAWVTIADAASLDLTTGMTLEAWVKPASVGGDDAILFKESPGSESYALYATGGQTATPAGYLAVNGHTSIFGPSPLALNQWSHLALTYDGAALSLYVNGTMVSSWGAAGAITTSTGVLRIGGTSVYNDFFHGLIDEVRVYNRALNVGDILSDMSTPIGGSLETTPPTVSMTNTAGTVFGTVNLAAVAADNVVVAGVQFLVNGQPVGAEDTTAPYGLPWNSVLVANGSYAVSARARDAAGNITISNPVTLTVSNAAETTPPTVAVSNPDPNAVVGGSLVVAAVAADNVGVVGVQFKLNGANLGAEITAAPYAVSWNTSTYASGTYSLTAVARDAAGNVTTSAAVPVVVDSTGPTVTGQTPAPGATAVPTDANPTVTFSESIQPGTLSFVLKDANGNPLAATVTYDDLTRTATLFPAAALQTSAGYSLTVGGVRDLVGNLMSGSTVWSFTADSHITGASIWSDGVVPAVPAAQNDSSPIEVGVKFRSAISGSILGIQFYKGPGNVGTHVGHLWTSTGTLLATATFTNETAAGWQDAMFASPVTIQANTTYIASYYAPAGRYAFTSGYFSTGGVNSSPLRALADGEDGGNGLFTYQTGGGFPTGTYQGANYWVDVVFSSTTQDTTAPTVTARAPAPGSTAVPVSSPVSVTFSESVQASSISLVLRDASNNLVPATVNYNDTTWTATLVPNAPLTASATYTATVSGALDAANNPMAAPVSWSFATAAPTTGTSIWSDSVVPAVPAAQNDSSSIEVGVKFRSDAAGYITGLRFYKGAGNTGTHVGRLWTSAGALLATATFANETATGWQQVSFSSPVPISPNTTYVASYIAPNGHYAFTSGFFASAGASNGPLHALADGVDGGNGLFTYQSGGGFPNGTYLSANYWVDVVYSPTAQDTTPPAVAARTPQPGATGVPTGTTVTVTFTEPVVANSLSFVLRDGQNNTIPATVSYNAATQTATLTPTAALAVNGTYTATVSASDQAGNPMSAVAWSFTTPTPATSASLWATTALPAVFNDSDTNAIEVGVRFFAEIPGYITGLRFFKGAAATGTHVGHLWTDNGTLLAQATFTNESASGWQTVTFASPVAITANTLYVASYYAPNGGYSATPGYFATSGVVNGYLHAPANGANGGNGLYGYVNGGGFPANTYNGNNYWVDVLFSQSTTDTTAPTLTAVSPGNGATGVQPTAPIQATFSEALNVTTMNFQVRDTFNATVTGNLAYNPATHAVTFIPAAPLLSFMTYTVTVTGVRDLSGNTTPTGYTWSFTTRGIWTQSTVSDFSTGTFDGTVLTYNADGEITLAPLLQEEFDGTFLNPTAWTPRSWASDGGGTYTASVAGGVLTVGGTALLSAQNYAATAAQGVVSFGAAAYQHFGLVTSFDSAAGNHWALFSTWYSTDRLFARVCDNGATTDIDLGPLPAGFHTYRVQPTSTGFSFYIDGVLATTIAAGGFQNTVPMRVGISDYSGSAGNLIRADRVWFESYSSTQTGTFTSTTFDAGQQVTWDTASWTANTPAGTGITIQVRTGNTAVPDATWSAWVTVTINLAMRDQNNNPLLGRYFQYRATLTTTVANVAPELRDISFTWA